jgi:anti-sigma factor RsiW
MTCETIRNELVAYRDGELSERAHEQVAAHLRTCPACAQEERQLARLDQLIVGLERMPLSPGFAATFWQRLEREQHATQRANWLVQWWRNWLESWRMVPAFAAAAGLLVFFGYILLSRQTPAPPQITRTAPSPQVAITSADIPPQVAEQSDLFVHYRVIANLDKFAHFEEIAAIDLTSPQETAVDAPQDLPTPLLENPSFFVHYPMLQKMEELQNFEAVLSLPGDEEKPNRG